MDHEDKHQPAQQRKDQERSGVLQKPGMEQCREEQGCAIGRRQDHVREDAAFRQAGEQRQQMGFLLARKLRENRPFKSPTKAAREADEIGAPENSHAMELRTLCCLG